MIPTISKILLILASFFAFSAPVLAVNSSTATLIAENSNNQPTTNQTTNQSTNNSSEQPLSGARKGIEAARGTDMPTDLIGENGIFNRITNMLLLVIGAISVFMLIYGGFRYVVSGGDNKKVTEAKNTILYAIIGLVIAIFSSAIVSFVLNTLSIK